MPWSVFKSVGETISPDTIGMVTMSALLAAAEYPDWKKYLEEMAMTIIGETEVLEAAGIHDGQIKGGGQGQWILSQDSSWYLVRKKKGIFLWERLRRKSVTRGNIWQTYPGMEIIGGDSSYPMARRRKVWWMRLTAVRQMWSSAGFRA